MRVTDTFEAEEVTLLEPIINLSSQKWDSRTQRMNKQLSKRKKLAALKYYDGKMAKGHDRDEILEQLEKRLGVSSRQVERILAQARKYTQEENEHHAQVSATALKLAEILESYFKYQQFTISPLISSDFPYTTATPELSTLNERELSNFMTHLEDTIPELIPIFEYPKVCKQWFALGDRKWDKETPTVTITKNLILKLKVVANQTNFSGRCRDCPR